MILFTFGGGPLFRVAADGGTPERITALDPGERGHAFPFFLPDNRHFVYTAWDTERTVADRGVYVGGVFIGSLDSADRTQVLDLVTNAEYARGQLLFMRDGALMAQELDLRQMATAGEPIVLVPKVFLTVPGSQLGAFSSSEGGVLAFETPTSPEGSQLVWMDRQGRRIGTLGSRSNYENEVELSPDGPRWRRDGREIFYWSSDGNRLMAVPVKVDGSRFEVGRPEPLFETRPRLESHPFDFYDVSADGQRFLVNGLEAQSGTPSLRAHRQLAGASEELNGAGVTQPSR